MAGLRRERGMDRDEIRFREQPVKRHVGHLAFAFQIDGLTSGSRRVYDPATNVESTSDGPLFVRRVGLAPGPPDSGPADFVIRIRGRAKGLSDDVAILTCVVVAVT